MTTDLINLEVERLPELYEKIKDLPVRTISENYGRVTDLKILGWALGCLYIFTLHKKGNTFEDIQKIILDNEQSPYYVSIPTLCREAWIWENIISKAPHLLKDNYLTKSHYKRMSQYKKQIKEPVEELIYIAKRKEEESQKHQKYSISRWEEERGIVVTLQKEYICDICNEKVDKFKKVCYNCLKEENNGKLGR